MRGRRGGRGVRATSFGWPQLRHPDGACRAADEHDAASGGLTRLGRIERVECTCPNASLTRSDACGKPFRLWPSRFSAVWSVEPSRFFGSI
ncbi:MAG: hypothetical protein ACLPR9_11805, partial [Acidimicrobiales bacterium]